MYIDMINQVSTKHNWKNKAPSMFYWTFTLVIVVILFRKIQKRKQANTLRKKESVCTWI